MAANVQKRVNQVRLGSQEINSTNVLSQPRFWRLYQLHRKSKLQEDEEYQKALDKCAHDHYEED